MTTSSKVVPGGTGRPNQVADVDSEPTVLAYRRPDDKTSVREAPRAPSDRLPAVILRIPQVPAELPGRPARKAPPRDLKNKLYWGGGIAAGVLVAALLLPGKKQPKHEEPPASDPQGARQAPGAAGPIAPLPSGQPLNMQPVPTYKEDNPRAMPGRMTPLNEPATLPPDGPSMPAPVAPPTGPVFSAPALESPAAQPPVNGPPLNIQPQQSVPRPSEQFMGQPPQHVMPWRQEGPPPAEQGPQLGPQLSPGDPRQGMNQPNRSPFTLPENDPRMGMPPGPPQTSQGMAVPQPPGSPVYRTAERIGQPGASFEGIIVRPNSEGQYDRSRPRSY